MNNELAEEICSSIPSDLPRSGEWDSLEVLEATAVAFRLLPPKCIDGFALKSFSDFPSFFSALQELECG